MFQAVFSSSEIQPHGVERLIVPTPPPEVLP